MLHVSAQDIEYERLMFEAVRDLPEFADIPLRQDLRDGALYDYNGQAGGRNVFLELKRRNISSRQFPTFFISKNKIEGMVPGNEYYVAYWFQVNNTLRVYRLDTEDLKSKDLDFTHLKAGPMTSRIYEVPAKKYLHEISFGHGIISE